MCDDNICNVPASEMTRRGFGLTAAAVAALAAINAHAAEAVVEKDVDIKTPDGTCDAALFYPSTSGSWPAVLIWTDNQGLRPAFRDIGRRMAAQGYTVLVPNPFYRSRRAPKQGDGFDFNNADDRSKITALASTLTAAGTTSDGVALIAYLDTLPQTNKAKKAGVQGYCMGGPLTFRTAAAVPDRIGAAMTFHGGNLVTTTPNPDSPHLLIPKMKGEIHCAIAQNDDMRQPDAKTQLKTAFDAAKLTSQVAVFPADHGWCVPGGATYNMAAAERAWTEVTDLYKRRLA